MSTVQQNHVSVGKMDLVWRSKFGDRGRIQTGQLKAAVHIMYVIVSNMYFIVLVQVPPLPELKLTVVEAPGSIQLEEPFTVTCRITNTTYVTIIDHEYSVLQVIQFLCLHLFYCG